MIDATYHGTAREVVDTVLERMIKALRADCRMPKLTRQEWEMFFARVVALAAEDLDWLDNRLIPECEAMRVVGERLIDIAATAEK